MAFNKAKISAEESLEQLVSSASERKHQNLAYAGEVFPKEAYDYALKNKSVIVDVRTPQEWQAVGIPDISSGVSSLAKISWKTYPDFALNPNFINEVKALPSVDKDTALFFLCRSGMRSLDAAIAMTKEGYDYCFNITYGFEGEPDLNGNRVSTGWKNENLPWVQG